MMPSAPITTARSSARPQQRDNARTIAHEYDPQDITARALWALCSGNGDDITENDFSIKVETL